MVYIYDAVTSPKAVQKACKNRFPAFDKTRAVHVMGINNEERLVSMELCCILETDVTEHYIGGDNIFISAGYCGKM